MVISLDIERLVKLGGASSIGNLFKWYCRNVTLQNIRQSNPVKSYEVQVKANSLTGCEEGWSTETYTFTTPMEVYVYNVDNTCIGVNSGQIEFEIISENSYTFNWQGPNGFSSNDTSIYNLADGNYNLQIYYGQNIIFDSVIVVAVSNFDIGISLNGDPSLISYSVLDGVYYAQACNLSSYIVAESEVTPIILGITVIL